MRPAFDALFDIDDAMADVVMRATQPALAAIKLAWWRERLEDLDQGKVPAEPRLRAAALELLPRGMTGAELAGLEEGWTAVLAEQPETDLALERGARLFVLAGRLLGAEEPELAAAGRLFAAADLERRSLHHHAANLSSLPPFPRRMRALTALAALARRDIRRSGRHLEPEATPGRAWTLLRHRLTGRL